MMRKNHVSACVLGLLAVLAACDSRVAPENESVAAPPEGAPSDGSDPSTSPPDAPGGGGSEDPDPREELPGVEVPDVAPDGCVGGFAGGALHLQLSASVAAVRLQAVSGKVVANGTTCTDTNDVEVDVTSLAALEIAGSAANEAVILDFESGDWSSLLTAEESIEMTLSGGDNTLFVRGTPASDHYLHGMQDGALVLALGGTGELTLVASGVTSLGVSLGAGDDRLEDLAGFLEGSGDSQSEPNFSASTIAITPLSIPLVAYGDEGHDWLVGGSADDEFDGGPGDDTASGLAGNDVFFAAATLDGTDTYNGGSDYDQITYELRSADLSLGSCVTAAALGCASDACECEHASGEPGEGDRILNMEDLTAGMGNDTLRGSDAADSLSGGPGDDVLYGLGGSDLLYGQRGIDALEGGLDGDYCDGAPDEQVVDCEL